MQVSTDGWIMFGSGDHQSTLRLNAGVWTTHAFQSDSMLYCRVTQDAETLARVQAIVSEQNPDLNFEPLLAVIITFQHVPVSCTVNLW